MGKLIKTTLTLDAIADNLQPYVKHVACRKISLHGGIVIVELEKGERFFSVFRLYEEAKSKVKLFDKKLVLSQKKANELKVFDY